MTRGELLSLLVGYAPSTEKEEHDLETMLELARSLEDPFSNLQLPGHFTASALPVDPGAGKVLLLHHKKLDRWLQPGGHIEPGDKTLVAATLREVNEETGLSVTVPKTVPLPFDIDVHEIPARPEMAAHLHLDLRTLVQASSTAVIAPGDGESERVRWFDFGEAIAAGDASARRLVEKAAFYLDW